MAQPLLALQEVSKYYVSGRNVVTGLSKVSLTFEKGEFVAITGESGSGKSTLAHIMGGILPYEDGELLLGGKPTSHYDSSDWEQYRADSVGFISQSYGILPGATVEENVVSALRLTGMEKEEATVEAKKILEEVELWPMRSRRAAKLSSGQKQRLSIARALAKPCDLLIADEPTGNLDPENSEKVINLLAKAAKDRLVVMVTHEFSEAENHVTRHITIQDGKVSADARLRPVPAVTPAAPREKCTKDLSLYTARLQLGSRPAWSMIVALFLALTAFAAFAFLGSYIVALDDTSTRIYESEVFLNGAQDRIVVVRKDAQAMTQDDYDTILSLKYVEQLERFGYVADIVCAWEEHIDYSVYYATYNIGEKRRPKYMDVATIQFLTKDDYVQTVPLFADDTEFVTEGTLPARFDQVVVAEGVAKLGDTISVHLCNTALWSSDYLSLEVTVVGITNHGSGIYFHEDVARTLTMDYLGSEYTYIPYYEDVPSSGEYENFYDAWSKLKYGTACPPFYATLKADDDCTWDTLGDTQAYFSMAAYVDYMTDSPQADFDTICADTLTTAEGNWSITGIHNATRSNVLAVNESVYRSILDNSTCGDGDQVSITITDYAYTDRVLNALDKAGYFAISPYQLGSSSVDPELASQRSQTMYICMAVLIAVLLLQSLVLRALFGMETATYRTMADLGLKCPTARKSIFWQMLVLTIAGQLLALAAIVICNRSGVSQIANLVKYLTPLWWVVICLVHFASTDLAAWLIGSNLKKRVYPRTGRRSDLNYDELDKEAAQ